MSPPDSLCSVQAASCEPLTAARSVLMINSSAQRAKCSDQTTPSSDQTANWSIDKGSSNVKTSFSSCRSAWSRSRHRRGRRPHEVFGFASNVLIIDGEFRKTFGQCSTLKRASRSLAKTGSSGPSWRVKTTVFLMFFEDGAYFLISRHANTIVLLSFLLC